MRYYYSGTNVMAEKALIYLLHFLDLFITGGLAYGFLSNIGEMQSFIYLGILIMFAGFRGALMLEDIRIKREARRRHKIDNDQAEWENGQKRK